jgi:hypothetical protein
MVYTTTISVDFPFSRERVYKELIDLGRYPLWNNGMAEISDTAPMKEGMQFTSKNIVVGQENVARITVEKLIPNKEIQMHSDTGIIAFKVRYELLETDNNQTRLVCSLRFELTGIALNFAHGVIESMAKTRLKGNFETLRELMAEH